MYSTRVKQGALLSNMTAQEYTVQLNNFHCLQTVHCQCFYAVSLACFFLKFKT